MLNRVLIANRGEIASRIIRTCRRLGVGTVAVYSDADSYAPYVREADTAWPLPGNSPTDTYLRGDLLIAAAVARGCDAIHPGYGFLSENAAFAQAVIDAGLTWIGPPPTAITAMGSKIEAKLLMRKAGVPVLPDSTVESFAQIGLPALVKASAGGGGRGMRIVHTADDLDEAIASGEREAAAAFGDGTVFVERFVEGGRHIEIQIFADMHGNTVSLFERDCTVQRRHQKIIEEAPSPAVDGQLRQAMSAAAVAAARAVGYIGAGTVEFLVDAEGRFSFLEMNTRLQVEHPVTEMITGLDLVELQLTVAAGELLPPEALYPTITGHAIEVRLCAEDPVNGYLPSSGTFKRVEFAELDGVRVDSAITSDSVVSPFYDSMVAKIVAHAPTRSGAINKLERALGSMKLIGPITNRSQLLDLLQRLAHGWNEIDTGWLDRHPPAEPPAPAAFVAAAALAWARSQRTALAHLPPAWRNNPSEPQLVRVGDHDVRYRYGRDGSVAEASVDGVAVEQGWMPALAFIETEIDGDVVFVSRGLHRFVIPPRFQSPDDAGREGSTTAPMPGSILRILVGIGDEVVAGQPLLAMEAMKMEHQVVSPAAGTVAEVLVESGQQVDSGQVLFEDRPGVNRDRPIRIANCSGFFGDRLSAAREMVDGGDIDVLTGDWLAELTMLILHKQRARNSELGYASTFLTQMEQVLGTCVERGIKVVSNAGGLNPAGCADRVHQIADRLGLDVSVAHIEGDDLMPRIDGLRPQLTNLDTGEPLTAEPVTANAYLGGWGIAAALDAGADVVVCPRVTDASLVVGPTAWWWNWERGDFDRLAGAVVAGHVIECGAQTTGGNYSFFEEIPRRSAPPGFPMAEVDRDGSAIITKHPGTGGLVSVGTVTAQLLYEIGGPAYANPDVIADFGSIALTQEAPDRVRIHGVRGSPPPPTTKVSINYDGGFRNRMTFVLTGLQQAEKAEWAASALFDRLGGREQFERVELSLVPAPSDAPSQEQSSGRLHVTVRSPNERLVGRAFSSAAVELALANYPGFFISSPPTDAQPYGVYWPALVANEEVHHEVVLADGRRIPIAPFEDWRTVSVHESSNTAEIQVDAVGPQPGEPLGDHFGARSGDKGGNANVGVWARDPAGYAWLDQNLTAAAVRDLIPEAADLTVHRYELPNLLALNFVIVGYLGRGVASNSAFDPQAKGLGEYLRSRPWQPPPPRSV